MKKPTILLLLIILTSAGTFAQLRSSVRGNVYMDFENLANFSLTFAPWSVRDVDGYPTYAIDGYTFPHMNETMAYICFNPALTTPSMVDDPSILPHGGERFAACFASQTHPNNDWIISPQVELGTGGKLKFWIKSYSSYYGLDRYKVGISTTNTEPSSFTIISPGSYLEAPAAAWQQKEFDLSAYANMDIFVGIQCVSDNSFILMLDDIEITSQSNATSLLSGMVTDAVTGNPIVNALVKVAGLTDYSDADGNYYIPNVPGGVLNANFTSSVTTGDAPLDVQFTDLSTESSLTVTASAAGYTNYTNSQVSIPEGDTLHLQISMSPALSEGQYRIVLTWGESPADLDAHLKTPEIEGNAYHIYFDNKGSDDSAPYAILDIDDTNSFGPETTTIKSLYPGEYHFFVHNYSESPEIITSNAVVQIYSKNGLVQTLQVPTTGTGLYWDVCTINGSNGNLSILNRIVETEPGSTPKLSPEQMIKAAPAIRNLVTWNWDFGDGSTSTEQHPAHTYSANGAYTVSLLVSDGQNTNAETKYQYIKVGPVGIDDNQLNDLIRIFPNPVSENLNINSEYEISILQLVDMQGLVVKSYNSVIGHFTFFTGDIPVGNYLLRIETSKGTVEKKISVAR